MNEKNHEHHFYGKPVLRYREEDIIESILAKYKDEPVTEALKKQIRTLQKKLEGARV